MILMPILYPQEITFTNSKEKYTRLTHHADIMTTLMQTRLFGLTTQLSLYYGSGVYLHAVTTQGGKN